MSRFSRALAAATMAVAAAGGGLLIAAAGTVPASASARPAPHRGHTITITAHPRAHAARGIGPRDILPCAVKPGSAIKPASCGDQTISCVITSDLPVLTLGGHVTAGADVTCTRPVTSISLNEELLRNSAPVDGDNDFTQNRALAVTAVQVLCQAGTYTNTGEALITFPPGYVLTGGSNPIHQTSASITIATGGCSSSGGGGCAIHAPSLAGHPAGRHPDFVSCG